MRISISHHTVRKGFIFKTTYYEVRLSVAFTHEEKQVIQMRSLADTKLLDRRPATARVDDRDEKFELRLRDLMDGRSDSFLCATPSKSKIYEEDILAVLGQVKLWIGDNKQWVRSHLQNAALGTNVGNAYAAVQRQTTVSMSAVGRLLKRLRGSLWTARASETCLRD